ncbi:MAG: 3-deoxy-D-manno-octulosonic acid transferase [Planktomarina sp.]
MARIQLALYRLIGFGISWLAPLIMAIRRAKGKEDRDRYTEKYGIAGHQRPPGKMIWINAVGLGEILSSRALINALLDRDPQLNFLVTSSTKVSAEVFARNLPPNTIHQYLPLDCKKFTDRFLTHWAPDIAIWIEQDFWPGFVIDAHARGIKQIQINGRMDERSLQNRQKWQRLYSLAYSKLHFVAAQDQNSAENLALLSGHEVDVLPNLKIVSPPLKVSETKVVAWAERLADRFVWMAASAHIPDIEVAIEAHKEICKINPSCCLIIVPRFPDYASQISQLVSAHNLGVALSSNEQSAQVIIETGFGNSGMWYELARCALIGGSFGTTEGHNPWEAVQHNCAVLHGTRIRNFSSDFALLADVCGSVRVSNAHELLHALKHVDFDDLSNAANWVVTDQKKILRPHFDRIFGLIS